jgi:hypothetical protein
MGQTQNQTYCATLCGERSESEPILLQDMMNDEADEPTELFAKKVKQHIELNPKTKETYLAYRKF